MSFIVKYKTNITHTTVGAWVDLYRLEVSKDTKNNKQQTVLQQSDYHWTKTELTDDYDVDQQFYQQEKEYYNNGKMFNFLGKICVVFI